MRVNLASNWRRSAGYRRKLAEYHRHRAEGRVAKAEAQERLERADERAEIWGALETLSPKLRETVVLFYLESNSTAEAAEALGVSEVAVKKRLQHARGKLRGYFEERWRAEMEAEHERINPDTASKYILAAIPLGPADGAVAKLAASSSWASQAVAPWLKGALFMSAKKTLVGGVCMLLLGLGAFWGTRGSSLPPVESVTDSAEPVASRPEPRKTTEEVSGAEAAGPSEEPLVAESAEEQAPMVEEPAESSGDSQSGSLLESKKIRNPRDYGSVWGRVIDGDLRPIADAEVTVLAPGLVAPKNITEAQREQMRTAFSAASTKAAHRFTAWTDEAGAFAIDGISFEGRARVFAVVSGYSRASEVVVIEPGMEAAYAELKVKAGLAIEGRVLDGANRPVTGAEVLMTACMSVTTSSTGDLSFSGVLSETGTRLRSGKLGWTFTDEEGRFELTVNKDYKQITVQIDSPTHTSQTFPNLLVEPDGFIDLRLTELASLYGRITLHDGAPASGYGLLLNESLVTRSGGAMLVSTSVTRRDGRLIARGGESRETVADARGGYRFEGLDTNYQYSVTITGTDWTELIGNIALHERVEIKTGQACEWNYVLGEAIRIRGQVLGAMTRRPLSDAKVAAQREGSQEKSAYVLTDARGRYELPVYAGPGTYLVSPSYADTTMGGSLSGTGFELTIELSFEAENELDLLLPERFTRSFLLVDGDGQPVADASPLLREAVESMSCSNHISQGTDEEGRLTLTTLSPGAETKVSFEHEDCLDAVSSKHVGEPDEVVPEETVVMYRQSGLAATLVDEARMPLADVTAAFTLRYGDGEEKDVRGQTDSSGFVEIVDGVPATVLSVEVIVEGDEGAEGLRHSAQGVECVPGLVTDLGTVVLGGLAY